MKIRFYNAKILTLTEEEKFQIVEGELWTEDNLIAYIGDGKDAVSEEKWDREIDAKGNLLMPGFKNAHTHTAMTFLRSFADLKLLLTKNLKIYAFFVQFIFAKHCFL